MAENTGESGFEIDGERYAIPTLDTITLDEERVLYIYADVVVSDFLPVHPDWKSEEAQAYLLEQTAKIRNPDFKRALVHIAYRRRHPELSDEDVNVKVGEAGALALDLELLRGPDREDPPTRSPNGRDESNEKSPLARSGDSGKPTGTSSGTPETTLASIGISESDTSSPESLPIASAS